MPGGPAHEPDSATPGGQAPGQGLLRSVRLFRLFLAEQADPDRFYTALAEDTARQLEEHVRLPGATAVDVGGGPGYLTAALRARGANCYLFEPDRGELYKRGAPPAGAVLASGYWLPVCDAGADICVSSNVLEHVADPGGLVDELVRITKPGGLIYLSFTAWLSPWGGHETSPWHYLGGRYAERRYQRRHREPPKNRFGSSLFPLHVGPVLRYLKSRPDVEVIDSRPRYYPRGFRAVLLVPGLREIVTWNLLTILRRTG
jgi:SAM-dependent methyltransferase